MSSQVSPIVLNYLISEKDTAECSCYNLQCIRRLLRTGKLAGLKLDQQWLVEMVSSSSWLDKVDKSHDNRFGSKKLTQNSVIQLALKIFQSN